MRKALILSVVLGLVLIVGISTSFAHLNDGLVAHYAFNGNANDESGNGNHGTVYGAALSEDRFGIANSAYGFDGVDDYIEVLDHSSLDIEKDISITGWIKVSAVTSEWLGILNKADHDGNDTFEICINSGKYLHFPLNFQFSGRIAYNSDSGIFEEGEWHFFAVIYDGPHVNIYIDGTLNQSYTSTNETLRSNDQNLIIGAEKEFYNGPHHFNGVIDDIRIYNRALSESEVIVLYNPPPTPAPHLIGHWDFEEGSGGTALDHSGNLLHGTIFNASYAAGKVGDYALDFNGSDSYVEVGYSPLLNPDSIAISLWFKPRDTQQYCADLLDKGHGWGTNPYYSGYVLQYDIPYGYRIEALYGNGAGFPGLMSEPGFNDNQWHHMVANLGAAGMAVYIDGVLVDEAPGQGAIAGNDSPLFFGRHRYLGRFFNGLIDDIRIYDGPLSQSEVTALFESPTLIQLDQFNAISRSNQIIITWSTSSEIDNAGFNLWRSESENGNYMKVNPGPIEAVGGATLSAEYSYIDDSAKPGVTYYYKLEDMDTKGISTFHGPVWAVLPPSRPSSEGSYPYWWFGMDSKELWLPLPIIQYPTYRYYRYPFWWLY
ncbi:MAG: LamG domain-containing protein [bacterium]